MVLNKRKKDQLVNRSSAILNSHDILLMRYVWIIIDIINFHTPDIKFFSYFKNSNCRHLGCLI